MNFLFQNGKGKSSKTATVYIITMLFVWFKFVLSDTSFTVMEHSFVIGALDPMLVGAMVGAAGAVYGWRRQQDSKERMSGDPEALLGELERLSEG